jgi:hypothetical protein
VAGALVLRPGIPEADDYANPGSSRLQRR